MAITATVYTDALNEPTSAVAPYTRLLIAKGQRHFVTPNQMNLYDFFLPAFEVSLLVTGGLFFLYSIIDRCKVDIDLSSR